MIFDAEAPCASSFFGSALRRSVSLTVFAVLFALSGGGIETV
jgi:hypothetical protein